MENVDFDNLDGLSIAELMAIYALAQEQLTNLQKERNQYGLPRVADSQRRHSLLGTYYTELAEKALNFANEQVFEITGHPLR